MPIVANGNSDDFTIIEPNAKLQRQSFINDDSTNLHIPDKSCVPDTPDSSYRNQLKPKEQVAKIENDNVTRNRNIRNRSYICSKTNFELDTDNAWKSTHSKVKLIKCKRPSSSNSLDVGYSIGQKGQKIIVECNALLCRNGLLRQEVELMNSNNKKQTDNGIDCKLENKYNNKN